MRRLPLFLAAALLAACNADVVVVLPESELPEDIYGSPAPQPEESVPEEGIIYLIRDQRLVPVPARLPATSSYAESLLSALLSAIPPQEMRTAIPPATNLIDVEVRSGVATVDLSDEFEQSAPGRALALRVAQIVFTITEGDRVFTVQFEIEGNPAAVLTGNEEIQANPVSRNDYRRFAPPSG